MKKFLFVFGLIATFVAVVSFDKSANAETFGCQANPRIGDTCTKRVTIRLRKVESEGQDPFDRRFEPASGWAIQDCDTRSGERGRTGEVSGPNCVEVQAGSTTTSSSYVQAQANRVYETVQKARVQGGNAAVQAFAEIENRARSEFSNLATNASVHQSRNYGVQINAWVAVEGGCRNRLPFGGDCINWGPGGSLDTDVIIRLVYVGTNQDIDQIAVRYIAEANRIAAAAAESERAAKVAAESERLRQFTNSIDIALDQALAEYNKPGEEERKAAFDEWYGRCSVAADGNRIPFNSYLKDFWVLFIRSWQSGQRIRGCG